MLYFGIIHDWKFCCSVSHIRAFSHLKVLWWGHRKSVGRKRWAEETRSFNAVFFCVWATLSAVAAAARECWFRLLQTKLLLLLPSSISKREKPDETCSHKSVHEKSRAFETQGPSNPHTSTVRVPSKWTVLSVISFLACASMQMYSKDDVSRWQSAMTVTTI